MSVYLFKFSLYLSLSISLPLSWSGAASLSVSLSLAVSISVIFCLSLSLGLSLTQSLWFSTWCLVVRISGLYLSCCVMQSLVRPVVVLACLSFYMSLRRVLHKLLGHDFSPGGYHMKIPSGHYYLGSLLLGWDLLKCFIRVLFRSLVPSKARSRRDSIVGLNESSVGL